MTALRDWNERLACHFRELRGARSNLPLFALEHGLSQDELRELSSAIRAHRASAKPSEAHWLAWIVYAAEYGYRFAGDQYWQTFESETPDWTLNDRAWLRGRFKRFQYRLGGAEPTGEWALHRTIICWPITHAILPLDLQQKLAQTLYELRSSLTAELLEDSSELGLLIAAHSSGASERFKAFTQQTALVGQIASALLHEDDAGREPLLHRATLTRICGDLDRVLLSREWLRRARSQARQRAMSTGFSSPSGKRPRSSCQAGAQVAAAPGVEPKLVLRPKDLERRNWEVSLEIPDLATLVESDPASRDFLTQSRWMITGSGGRWLARGRLLRYGAQRVTLRRWPRGGEVLIEFERAAPPKLEALLKTECSLRAGPWLLRVASDGLAYELRGRHVRAGQKYLRLDTSEPALGPPIHEIDISCEGIRGVALDLPAALTPEWEETLSQLGLEQAKSLEIWPAGLGALAWDGDGRGEWLTSERPTLALQSDHTTGPLRLYLDESSSLEIADITPGEPVFVELPLLTAGLHRVCVFNCTGRGDIRGQLAEIEVRIREAPSWSPGEAVRGPLSVEVDPPSPTLEQLWEARAGIEASGPEGRSMSCHITFFSGGHTPRVFELPRVALPLTRQTWRRHLINNLTSCAAEAQTAYDSARACELVLSADELGAFKLYCEREFTPLRWTLRRRGRLYTATLHDDVDYGEPNVARLPFERPTQREALSLSDEYVAPPEGGLYLATHGAVIAALIVPPLVLLSDESPPKIGRVARTLAGVASLLESAALWGSAHLPGDPVSRWRSRNVLREIASALADLLCGARWAALERPPRDLRELKSAITRHPYEQVIGASLAREIPTLAKATNKARVRRLAELAARSRSKSAQPIIQSLEEEHREDEDLAWNAEFALRIASDPAGATAWAADAADAGIERLLDDPALARAARYLVLAIDHELGSRDAFGELYAGWEWS